MTRDQTNTPARSGGLLPAWIAGGVAVVVVLQVVAAWQQREALARMEETAARIEKAAIASEQVTRRLDAMDLRLERIDGGVGGLVDDWDFLVDDVVKLSGRVDELITAVEGRDGVEVGGVAQPPDLDWTQPDLFAAAQRAAETVGITLTEDEVRVPARMVLREGILEYFAVLKGGKEHEALLSLVGNLGARDRRPRDFGAKLNNAIQALGFARGTPIRFSPSGTRPPKGDTVYLFVEWVIDGETDVVRAEDLIWDRVRDISMPHGSWVYVGSSWVEGENEGELDFAADLTAEAVATYSAVNTIIDTRAEGAQDDTVFLVATPRLPDDVVDVTLVIRRKDREPTRTFPIPERDGEPADADGE